MLSVRLIPSNSLHVSDSVTGADRVDDEARPRIDPRERRSQAE
jgi:hypothetical protein